ncbi:18947_t:CDS:2 [Gigaspora rosea]|nr:18947_t:CDS:2 [Gigaspora rosea]
MSVNDTDPIKSFMQMRMYESGKKLKLASEAQPMHIFGFRSSQLADLI